VFADHDFLTENTLRFLGPMVKMIVAPIIVLCRRTFYSAVVEFEPAPVPKDLLLTGAYADPKVFAKSERDPSMRRIEDSFWCFAVGNLREAGGGLMPVPNVRMCEGAADILMVRRSKTNSWLGRLTMWRSAMMFLSMDDGSHTTADDVEIVKCSRLRLEPGVSSVRTPYPELLVGVQLTLARNMLVVGVGVEGRQGQLSVLRAGDGHAQVEYGVERGEGEGAGHGSRLIVAS
jgi:hypothetical protein